MIIGQSGLAGSVTSAAKVTLAADITYIYCASVDSVIRYTTSGGADATATPAAGDIYVPAKAARFVKLNNGATRLSIIAASTAGVYTLNPVLGF